MKQIKHPLFAPVLLLTAAACGGGPSIEGEIGTMTFDLHTVYAWIDATESKVDDMSGKLVFTPRMDKDLHVVLSGASYDPEVDARFLSAEDVLEIDREEVRNGSIGIQASKFDSLAMGMQLSDPMMGGDGPHMNASHRFAAQRIDADATYPMAANTLGSRTQYTMTFDELGREPGESISGSLVIAVVAGDNDPAGVVTGSMTVDFSAPLIGERIAECNRGEGRNSTCEILP